MRKFKRLLDYIRYSCILVVAMLVSPFIKSRPFYKDLWIISERGSDARDNAYHFFKYLRREHPQINAVYIITKDSIDLPKVSALGEIVAHGSFKHYLCYILAKVRVSTHIEGYTPDMLFFLKFKKFIPIKGKNIFLQHGIIKDNLIFCHACNTKIDMFVCSAVPEYEYIDKIYGYKKGVLQLTGLCRYDNLRKNDKPTRKILFMPTWYLSLRNSSRAEFEKSDYFKNYNGLLNSEKLIALLEEYDYELVFYPHFEVQRFIQCFGSNSDRVKIADFEHSDVQDLLINSDILLTDYSSVYYDYGYMRKPMVYYQYDEQSFRNQQYSKGYFDYKRDGFGKVAKSEDQVIDELRHILEKGAKPDEEYLNKMNAFFKFNDRNNCRRTFDAILKLL